MRIVARHRLGLVALALLSGMASLSAPSLADQRTANAASGDKEYRLILPVVYGGSNNVRVPTGNSIPVPTPAPQSTSVPLGAYSRLGVWTGPADDAMLTSLQQAGAQWTRFHLDWATIEPNYTDPATYDFTEYDNYLAASGRAGMTAIVEIRGNPSWAAATRCGPIGRIDRFAEFLRTLVNRYRIPPYNVKHWEFFNEPDNKKASSSEFVGGCFGDQPGGYVEVLRVAYTVIKAVDPEAKIVLGGLAFDQWSDPTFGPVFNTEFLDQILALGAGAYFDVANVHYYSSQTTRWSTYGKDLLGKVAAFREVMARHNTTKPVVVTETNWTSGPGSSGDILEQQARYVPKVLARGLAANLYAVYWFMLKEWPGADYPYGLVDLDLKPRPAYHAYQVAADEFGRAATIRPLSPSELGVAGGIEGYAFDVDGQVRWVLWADDGVVVNVRLPETAAQAHDKQGQSISLADHGQTTIALDDSPIYVRFR